MIVSPFIRVVITSFKRGGVVNFVAVPIVRGGRAARQAPSPRRRPRRVCKGGGCLTPWVEVGASTRAQTRDGLRHSFVEDLNRVSATFPFQRWALWVVTLIIRTVVCPVRGGFGYRHVTEIQCYLGSWRWRLCIRLYLAAVGASASSLCLGV